MPNEYQIRVYAENPLELVVVNLKGERIYGSIDADKVRVFRDLANRLTDPTPELLEELKLYIDR